MDRLCRGHSGRAAYVAYKIGMFVLPVSGQVISTLGCVGRTSGSSYFRLRTDGRRQKAAWLVATMVGSGPPVSKT